MAINKNHEFDDLEGVKCAIVERNSTGERVQFLKELLEVNGYAVVVVKSPPPKAVPQQPAAVSEMAVPEIAAPPVPETFTIGVTDVAFNVTNALFGRMLKTAGGKIVTPAYWFGKEEHPDPEIPYYEKK